MKMAPVDLGPLAFDPSGVFAARVAVSVRVLRIDCTTGNNVGTEILAPV